MNTYHLICGERRAVKSNFGFEPIRIDFLGNRANPTNAWHRFMSMLVAVRYSHRFDQIRSSVF